MSEVVSFYEIPIPLHSADHLPRLSEIERTLFEAINNAGAATRSAIVKYGQAQGYSQMETSKALSKLVVAGCVERRTLTEEIH